jgi:hypothetical protein
VGALVALSAFWMFGGAGPAEARITSITYTTSQPYGTQSIGSVGQYIKNSMAPRLVSLIRETRRMRSLPISN